MGSQLVHSRGRNPGFKGPISLGSETEQIKEHHVSNAAVTQIFHPLKWRM